MMRNRIVPILVALIFCGAFALIYAQQQKSQQLPPDRVDLETETLVGKRLERTETGPNGEEIYHYIYRVQAQATVKEMPRYTVDPLYNVSYELSGFRDGDSIRLRSTNRESATDSPIWVYDITYVGNGTRFINFSTSGSVMAPVFFVATGENDCPDCGNDPCTCNDCPDCGNDPCTCKCPDCQQKPCICGECPDCGCKSNPGCGNCPCHDVITEPGGGEGGGPPCPD